MQTNIAVLLSTYNGETYLKELLDSILTQKLEAGQQMTIFIRDDGSTDGTREILREYAGKYDSIRLIDQDRAINLGFKESFFALLAAAMSDGENDYFAFSDQDDVWLPDKIRKAVEKLEECSGSGAGGRLYFSNKTITDEALNPLRKEDICFRRSPVFAVKRTNAYGCTMVFDRTLAELNGGYIPSSFRYHDSWMFRLALCVGAEIVFDHDSYILYRQHKANAVGELVQRNHSFLDRAAFFFEPRNHSCQKMFSEIYSVFKKEVDAGPYAKEVRALAMYTTSLRDKMVLVFNKDVMKTGPRAYFLWVVRVMGNLI